MEIVQKIKPILVGVTGHRNVCKEDYCAIKVQVAEVLSDLRQLCKSNSLNGKDTPIIMLNSLAQGADFLCAEVAFELGIPIIAVLPCTKEKYIQSFDKDKRDEFNDYLDRAAQIIICPDMEQNIEATGLDRESYEYRQAGIYVACNSRALIALWDGKEPKSKYGCGTAEAVNFALKKDFINSKCWTDPEYPYTPVAWIKSRREGDDKDNCAVCRGWLSLDSSDNYVTESDIPQRIKDVIEKTVSENDRLN